MNPTPRIRGLKQGGRGELHGLKNEKVAARQLFGFLE